MNDQHGFAAGYDGASPGAFDATSFDADPLFGTMPGTDTAGHSGQWDNSAWSTGSYDTHGTGAYDTFGTGAYTAVGYDGYAAQHTTTTGYDTGAYDTSAYGTGSYDTTAMWATTGQQPLTDIPNQSGQQPGEQWDAGGQWGTPDLQGGAPQGFDHSQSFEAPLAFGHPQPAAGYETGAYDATAWNSVDTGGQSQAASVPAYDEYATTSFEHPTDPGSADAQFGQFGTGAQYTDTPLGHDDGLGNGTYSDGTFANGTYADTTYADGTYTSDEFAAAPYADDHHGHADELHPGERYADDGYSDGGYPDHPDDGFDARDLEDHELDGHGGQDAAPAVHFTPGSARGGLSRSRRRAPARRSALLTVAVPSVCALGVAGIAAASVTGGFGGGAEKDDTKTQAAPDPSSVKPSAANNELDTQLANLSADADDFADRASRTQERIDLKERQVAEKKRKADEAARKEAARPKFALPVKQQGLSAYYGQAGVNWMSAHSGIDFPVSYGTEVLAATDGTVRTQWNPAYGNMAIVTAEDGTETWYCHLSSTKIRSGSVEAGDSIAYSGNSGNSTGPHLHFEVRPGGGSAIDPLAWLRQQGLDPT